MARQAAEQIVAAADLAGRSSARLEGFRSSRCSAKQSYAAFKVVFDYSRRVMILDQR